MLSLFEKPNLLLRLEALAVFVLALSLYWQLAYSWPLFWSTVLLPDLAILGYFINSRVGARLYNITHAKLLPGALAVVAIVISNSLCSALALVWFVHIGLDRMLGYGLKYPEGFKHTHLGMIGKIAAEPGGGFSPCWK